MWTEGFDDKKATSRTPDGKMPGESRCSPREIQNYLNRVSGSLLDRIDIHVEVPAVKFREITAERTGESSAQIRERVVEARKRQQERFKGKRTITCNEGETNPSLTQTAPGIPDSTNAKYDDTDLDGDAMVGRVEKALGKSPLASDNPLTLTQVITGQEPDIAHSK